MSKILANDASNCLFRITNEIASQQNVRPTELQPIHDYVDPDALSTLIESADESLTFQFSYLEYTVVVNGDGSIHVTEQS